MILKAHLSADVIPHGDSGTYEAVESVQEVELYNF